MTFSLAGTIVEILDIDANGVPYSAPMTGVLISRNEVLITEFAVDSMLNSSSPVTVNLSVDPASITSTDLHSPSGFHLPTGIHGLPIYTVTASSVHHSANVNGESVALIDLGSNVDLSTTVGYVGLAQDTNLPTNPTLTYTTYPSTSGPATQYFPTITQQTFSTAATEQPSNQPTYAPYYSTYSINPPSGTPDGLGAIGTITDAGAIDVASVRTGFGPNSGGYNTPDAAMTPTMVAQIEYWQALDGESPAIQRLYHGLLGRAGATSELAFYSTPFANDQVATAKANGTPFATSMAVFAAHPDLVQDFFNSPEFQSKNPGGISDSALVTMLFNNDLGRAPSSGDLSFYLNHGYTQVQLVAFITGSPEAIAHSGLWGQTGV